MRIDMGNPYNAAAPPRDVVGAAEPDEPIIGGAEMDAACVVVNLFMLPDEPDLFRQCVANIAACAPTATATACR
jgi:fructose-bisphosphate aldolase, class I